MPEATESESRKLLGRLREVMAGSDPGQARLDKITQLIGDSMGTGLAAFIAVFGAELDDLVASDEPGASALPRFGGVAGRQRLILLLSVGRLVERSVQQAGAYHDARGAIQVPGLAQPLMLITHHLLFL